MEVNRVLTKKNTVLTKFNTVLTKNNTVLTKMNKVLTKENTAVAKVKIINTTKEIKGVWRSGRVAGCNPGGRRIKPR
jgi:hypothetical protein